jgi:2-methylisocitrate lyase-like PEP mutase family enzyme
MTATQDTKAAAFQALHRNPGTFVIANAWDGGSARVLQGLGFAAIATSSGASANTLGRLDGKVTRDEALSQARTIVGAVDLPVSADFENGFGDTPEIVAETVRLAAGIGLAGCSIEDSTGQKDRPLYDFGLAVERIAAAAQAARALPGPFTLTARSENFLRGNPNLDDTIKRLQAYEKAGADALFAPLLPDLAAVKAVCSAVTKPVNFMVGVPGKSFSVAELTAAGVKRISLATSLYRAAMTGLFEAAREVKEQGTFGYLDRLMDVNKFMRR